MRSAREALSKIVISYSRVLYPVLQFRANRLRQNEHSIVRTCAFTLFNYHYHC